MTVGTATRERGAVEPRFRVRPGRWARSAVVYGVVAAVVAVAAGQWFGVSPPAAYGLCSACHGRDLSNWVLNRTQDAGLFVTAAGAVWPLLTVVGLVIGSTLAALRNGELGSVNIGGNARQFLFGGVVMCAALFVGGCPTRIILRTGYGDLTALLVLGGVATGVVIATLSMRWVARR
jgi:hypothetical protein